MGSSHESAYCNSDVDIRYGSVWRPTGSLRGTIGAQPNFNAGKGWVTECDRYPFGCDYFEYLHGHRAIGGKAR